MKRINFYLALAIFIFAGYAIFAQTDSLGTAKKKIKFEAGLNLYTYRLRDGDFYSGYKSIADNYVLNGIYLKIHSGKNALRASCDFLQRLTSYNKRGYYYAPNKDNVFSSKSLQLSAGYQRFFTGGKVAPYVFADLGYAYTSEIRSAPVPYTSIFSNFYYDGGYYSFTRNSMFSVSPGLGLRIKMGKHLIANIEASAQFYYAIEGNNTTGNIYKTIGINFRSLCGIGFLF